MRKQRQQGFTLIEVLVVMMIFAIIGIASYQVFSQMVSADEQTRERQAQLQDLQYVMLTLERDIRQIVARPLNAPNPEQRHRYLTADARALDSDSGALGFVRSGWQNPGMQLPRSELQPVIYRIRENKLQRLSYPYVDDANDEPDIRILLSGVTALQVRFWLNGEWLREWQRPGALPDLIEVTLTVDGLGDIRRLMLVNGGQFVSADDINGNNADGTER
ncbi:type II secretion system minor pseudopilin GspJ [Idiomarina xiamenensis]|nr:type II secretion system minor pseudopilin GspJ [Idiomarina xiamenensis]